MDYQNAEFYRLNKNNTALIFNFAGERITYRKETDDHGNLQIVEYRKKDNGNGKKVTTRRVLRPYEMSIAAFDEWKERLTEEAHEDLKKDKRETRDNVPIENLLETDLVCDESAEEEYLRVDEERQALPKDYKVMYELLDLLTPTQKSRYIKSKVLGKSSRDIAEEEGCSHTAVLLSLEAAEKRLNKELKKRGYIK